jgi:DNA-binding NarL/FixJ family response regulator
MNNETSSSKVTSIRILLVEDHVVMRQGLKVLLADEPGLEVVGEAGDGRQALRLVSQLRPGVVLMDIAMPHLNGIETTRQIQQTQPEIKVVVLSMHATEEYVFQLLRAGAAGYVLKQSASTEVIAAIRAAVAGELFLSPRISRQTIDAYFQRAEARGDDENFELLSSREREVLQLLAEGHSNESIADELTISVKTVETHRLNMMRKLGVDNKIGLIRYAYRKGWTSPDI